MEKFLAVLIAALLLGAQNVQAQFNTMTPAERPEVTCLVNGVAFTNEGCGVAPRILAKEVVPFGPDILTRDAIGDTCEKIFHGFMDENRWKWEERERHFLTKDGYDCFKSHDKNGNAQVPRSNGKRELGSKKGAPKKLYGTTNGIMLGNGRHRR